MAASALCRELGNGGTMEGRKGCPERRESSMGKWHRHAPERETGALGSGGCEDFQGRQGFLKFVTQKTLIIRWQDGSAPQPI